MDSPHRTFVLPHRVDLDNEADVEMLLLEALADGGTVLLDCAQLRFIDSAGAKMLFQLAEYAAERRCKVHLVNLQGGPLRVLSLLGVFELYPDLGSPMGTDPDR